MISFILSLAVIDRQQAKWRLSQHSQAPESLWHRLTHWSWLHPEPYQDARDSTWKHIDSASGQIPPNADFQGWYARKKHRAVAKIEISDAFEMRARVVAALLAWVVICGAVLIYAVKRMFGQAIGL